MVEWERLTDDRFAAARAAGERGTREQYAFDALMEMATRSHRVRSGARSDGREESKPATRENLRHLGLIRVDLTSLLKGGVGGGELCEIAGVGPISVAAARELLGESILKLVITKGVDVVNVTHLGRGPTVAQEIALLWANPICCVEGCNRVRRLQWDHRKPWAEVRETVLRNLDGPCDFHHAKKTREGWELVEGRGRRPMVPPGDPRHPGLVARGPRAPNAPPAA